MRTRLLRGLVFTPLLLVLFTTQLFAQGNYIYTNNHGSGKILGFSVGSDGSLTQIPGSPFSGGDSAGGGFLSAHMITSVQVGNFLFASLRDSGSIRTFRINPATGFLTPVAIATDPSAMNTQTNLAASPDGKFLFSGSLFTDTSTNISAFRIGTDGTLTPVQGSPFTLPGGLFHMQISPDGRFLGVAQWFSRTVALFNISPDGRLTPASSPVPVQATGLAVSLHFNCEGNRLFVLELTPDNLTTVDVFNVASNGALTPITGSPFIGVGSGSEDLLLSPNGRHLFVSNLSGNSIEVFNVASTGSLSLVPGSPFPTVGAMFPTTMATNQEGTFLYVAHIGLISAFTVASNGMLSLVQGSPFSVVPVGVPLSITAYPAKSCVSVPIFDICIQDESNGNLLQINTTSGTYQFTNCDGLTIGGIGILTKRGNQITLQHNAMDRRVMASMDTSTKRATASVQLFSQGRLFSITDRNITNNTCTCR